MLWRILAIITPVMLICLIGWGYGRWRKPDMAGINRLNVELLTPLLVFVSMAARDFHLAGYLPLLGIAGAIMLGSGLIGWGVARLLGYNVNAFVPSMMFSNTANMGLPLTLFAFGPAHLPAAVAIFMLSSLLHFTIGMRLVDGRADLRGLLRVPMLWALAAGLAVNLSGLALPEPVVLALKSIGETSIPLMLFALGVRIADFRISRWTAGVVGGVVCSVSGLLIGWPLVTLIDLPVPQAGVLLLFASLPPAVMNYLLAEEYRQDPELVAAIVVAGTLLSLLFVPFALYLAL